MATTSRIHLDSTELSDDEQAALSECSRWLSTARFVPLGSYELCDDIAGLQIACQSFITKFAPWRKFNSASRLTAIRFKRQATLAVQGATNIMIPVTILDGTPAVGGRRLQVGSYIHLMEDVDVDAAFYCLLLKPQ